jgi:DNA-binding MarR family transcriptional regulator
MRARRCLRPLKGLAEYFDLSLGDSRAVRRLETAGLVRRDADQHDARRVRLYPTEKARENLQRLREVWSHLLEDAITDSGEIDSAISTLRQIETRLLARTSSPRRS